MADEISIEDLDRLRKAGQVWKVEAASALRFASQKVDELKYSATQFGLFVLAWEAYSKVPSFVQDRLNEGAFAAENIGTAVETAAASFEEQQWSHEQGFKKITEEIG